MKNTFRILTLSWLVAIAITSCRNESKIDDSNPFFSEYKTPFGVPPFDKIYAAHYMPAFERGMNEKRRDLEELLAVKEDPTFANTIEAYDKMGVLLDKVSEVFLTQSQANTNDSLQKIETEITPKLAAFRDELSLNPKLFERVKSVYDNQARLDLTDEQKFLLENLYMTFIRNGANLKAADQDSLKSLNRKLSVLTVKFNQNVLTETNRYRLFMTSGEDLKGLPEGVISAAADEAGNAGFEGKWAFTTKRPSIFPFLTYSRNRERRNELFSAYIMRGNNGNEFDNNKVLAEIVRLRAGRAKLLGYKNHSSLILEPRMAKNPENVDKLLMGLWDKALPVAVKERDEMQKMINRVEGKARLEAFDWWYYSEKLRKQKYDLEESELRPYFKLENVREGAFEVAYKLFGITFQPMENAPVPHPEALAYEVMDTSGSHLGVIYMDFFPRPGKQQGAWCLTLRTHNIADGKEITPIVTMVYNFTRPTGNTPALLSLDEVSTLFHEFGHALDALFNKATYNMSMRNEIGVTNAFTAWDFVELPSQLMEHWCTEPEVLSLYAKHYKTDEVIPAALIRKIKNSGYFNQGFVTVEYLASALLDMSLHTLEAPAVIDIQKFEKDYFTRIGLIPEIVPRYRSTYFLHIAGDYDSGYYSYIWAAVLDNDAFSAFRERGLFDKITARSLRKNILEKNGTMDAMQMFVNFRGRQPVIEPLLKDRGLI